MHALSLHVCTFLYQDVPPQACWGARKNEQLVQSIPGLTTALSDHHPRKTYTAHAVDATLEATIKKLFLLLLQLMQHHTLQRESRDADSSQLPFRFQCTCRCTPPDQDTFFCQETSHQSPLSRGYCGKDREHPRDTALWSQLLKHAHAEKLDGVSRLRDSGVVALEGRQGISAAAWVP